jgi:multiple sugar transport system permease protein
MNDLRLVDTLFVLILPYTFKAFAVFILRQQMMNIPDAYLDADAIDGASLFRSFITYLMQKSVSARI